MAISKHPLTGVPLNETTVKRKALDKIDAVTVHVLKRQGRTYTEIVHMLGTNANRVDEVLRGDVWPDAVQIAIDLTGGDLLSRR